MTAFNVLGGGATAAGTSCVHKSYSKPSQLHHFNIAHLQSPKIKIRAFSVSSKLRKTALDAVGVDYTERRFTIGDVVDKDTLLNTNYPPQTLAAGFIGILKVAATFLVKVSFWASLAGSSVAALAVTVSAVFLFGMFSSDPKDCLLKYCPYVFHEGGTLDEIVRKT